ncbi:MAG: MCP four helix bundle domain-containing protein, partial [Burkholderiales bacterium]
MLKNLKIGTRLAVMLGSVIFMMVVSSVLALVDMRAIEDHLDEIVHDNIQKMNFVQDMSESVHIVSRVMRTVVLLHDDAAIDKETAKIDAARAKYTEAESALDKFPASEKGMAIRTKIKEARDRARELNNKVIKLAHEHQDKEALDILLNEGAPATLRWQEALDENIHLQKENTAKDYERAVASYVSARNILIIVCVVALLLASSLGYFVTKSITVPLFAAVEVAQKVARG